MKTKKKFYDLGSYTNKGRLPTNVKIISESIDWSNAGDDAVTDALTDTYGFCVKSCNSEEESVADAPNLVAIYVTDIEWDRS